MSNKRKITKEMIIERAGMQSLPFQITMSLVMYALLLGMIIKEAPEIKGLSESGLEGTLAVVLGLALFLAITSLFGITVTNIAFAVSDVKNNRYKVEIDTISSLTPKGHSTYVKYMSYSMKFPDLKLKLPEEESNLKVGDEVILITDRHRGFITVFNNDDFQA